MNCMCAIVVEWADDAIRSHEMLHNLAIAFRSDLVGLAAATIRGAHVDAVFRTCGHYCPSIDTLHAQTMRHYEAQKQHSRDVLLLERKVASLQRERQTFLIRDWGN
jgi:hypothetical protein